MKKLFYRLRLKSQQGQSLVEMAITAPILVFMLLGVFEVGWALRGYLVLTNVNREITRFAVRPGYLDYTLKDNSTTSATTVGYSAVLSYVYTTLADELPLDFSTGQTATLIISHLVADTGKPFSTTNIAGFDCSRFVTQPTFYMTGTDVMTYDDLILYPGLPGYQYFYAYTFPMTSAYRTRLDYAAEAAKMARENNRFNCELLKKSGGTIPAANNVIITEIHYRQPQLFGFPIIANPYTNPVPMYAHTAMRMIVASRFGENVDTVGPVCDAYPFAFTSATTPTLGSTVNILNGGWLDWNGDGSGNEAYLINELTYSRMALNDFKDASQPGDKYISVGDRVAILGSFGSQNVRAAIGQLVGKQMRVPIGSGSPFVISRFGWVQITVSNTTTIDPAGIPPTVQATYLGDAGVDSGGYNICLTSD